MDDLRLVREYGAATPFPDAASVASARADLLAGMGKNRHRLRLGVIGGSTVGIAAAAAVVAIVMGSAPEPSPQAAPPGGTPVTETSATENPAVETPVDASRVLLLAATAARSQPDVQPRPDQFVYTRTGFADGGVREIWLSVDGTRDGVLKQHGESIPLAGCRDGRAPVIKGAEPLPGVTEECVVRPAYRPDLPTTVDGMLAYLDANASGSPGDVNARGKDVLFLISESYLRPAARAALYEAAARVPGLRTVPDATDGAGRRGIGITWPVPEGSDKEARPTVVVFDAKTYAHLGTQHDSVQRIAIVDKAGVTG